MQSFVQGKSNRNKLEKHVLFCYKIICLLIQIEASPKEKVNNADFDNSEVFFPLSEVSIDEIDVLEKSGSF